MRGVFVTGTDTDVGKTLVSAALTLGLEGRYWKPIQAGRPTDTDRVREWTGLPDDRFLAEAHVLREPMSPHAAAAIEGVAIDFDQVVATPRPDDRPIVVEGAGGLMVPIDRDYLMIDLLAALDLPAVLVARTTLGTLNHTLLSIEALRARDIPLLGVVLNGDEHPSNRETIAAYGDVPILGRIPRLDTIDAGTLQSAFAGLAFPPLDGTTQGGTR